MSVVVALLPLPYHRRVARRYRRRSVRPFSGRTFTNRSDVGYDWTGYTLGREVAEGCLIRDPAYLPSISRVEPGEAPSAIVAFALGLWDLYDAW